MSNHVIYIRVNVLDIANENLFAMPRVRLLNKIFHL